MIKRTGTVSPHLLSNDCVLFRDLNHQELEKVAAIGHLKIIQSQEYLFHQHSAAKHVFNVISGIVMVERTSSAGKRQILGFIFPGDFIGLTHSDFFDYSVKSLGPAQLCEFQRQQLVTLSEEISSLKHNIDRIGVSVLARALDQIYILGQKKAHERLCFLFMQLLERMPDASPERIDLPMTRLDIADYLGLTIETVSRSFARLKKDGLIATPSPQRLQILNLEQISSLASAN